MIITCVVVPLVFVKRTAFCLKYVFFVSVVVRRLALYIEYNV